MSVAPSYYLEPVTQRNAKLVVVSGKLTVVPEPSTHNMGDIIYGVLIGLVPGVPAFLSWAGGLFKARADRQAKLDDGFIEWLKNDNLELRSQVKELSHQLAEVQIAVGTNQQKVAEVKAESNVVKVAANTLVEMSEKAKEASND